MKLNRPSSPVGILCSLLLCGNALVFGTPITYTASLSGPAEFPANASPGTGFTTVTYDSDAHTLRVEISFSGLLGLTTASHIHAPVSPSAAVPTAGVATQTPSFAGFPLGVTSGTFDGTFDLTLDSSWRAAFITDNGGTAAGAEAALATALHDGEAYLNIHSTQFPGGEIRGFLTQAQTGIPDGSATMLLLVSGFVAVLGFARHQRIQAA